MKQKILLIVLLFITIKLIAQDSKFSVELNYPFAINFVGEDYNGIINLGADYRFLYLSIWGYTAHDYIEILKKLNSYWEIDTVRSLNDEAQKARDYLMKLPARLLRISERMKFPEDQYNFKWVEANGRL